MSWEEKCSNITRMSWNTIRVTRVVVWSFKTDTLVFRIEVQDILIIFQHFSSQDILIKDRTFINFERFQEIKWFHREKWSEKVNKMQKMVKNMSIPTKISSQDIYSGQDVYYFGINFPPGLLFRTRRLLGTLE